MSVDGDVGEIRIVGCDRSSARRDPRDVSDQHPVVEHFDLQRGAGGKRRSGEKGAGGRASEKMFGHVMMSPNRSRTNGSLPWL